MCSAVPSGVRQGAGAEGFRAVCDRGLLMEGTAVGHGTLEPAEAGSTRRTPAAGGSGEWAAEGSSVALQPLTTVERQRVTQLETPGGRTGSLESQQRSVADICTGVVRSTVSTLFGDVPAHRRHQMLGNVTTDREDDADLRWRARCLVLCSVLMVLFQALTTMRDGQGGTTSPCTGPMQRPHEAMYCNVTSGAVGRVDHSPCSDKAEMMTRSDWIVAVLATFVIAVAVTEEIKDAQAAHTAVPVYLEPSWKNQLAG